MGLSKCDVCQAESPLAEFFVRRRSVFGRKFSALCPGCRGRISKSKMIFLGVAVAAIAVAWGLKVWLHGWSNEPAALWFLRMAAVWVLVVVFQFVFIVPHEMGHACAGWLMGYRIYLICLGRGERWFRWDTGLFVLELRKIPVMGFVMGTRKGDQLWKLRRFVFIAAGPVVNLSLGVVMFAIARQWSNAFEGRGFGFLAVSCWAMSAANFCVVVSALLGRGPSTSVGTLRSDGRQLRELLFKAMPLQERELREVQGLVIGMIAVEKPSAAIAAATAGLERFPQDGVLRANLATAQLFNQEYSAARQTLRTFLDDHQKIDPLRGVMANNLAWACVMMDSPDLLPEADAASTEAMRLMPWAPFAQQTRGLVLLELGEIAAAVRLLEESKRRAETEKTTAAALCSLAIANCRLGKPEKARQLVHRVEKKYCKCELLDRARRELATSLSAIAT